MENLWSASEVAGALPMLLALSASARPRATPGRMLFAILGPLALLLALGRHGVLGPLLFHLPGWSTFRYPEKYMAFVALAVAVLGAWGSTTGCQTPAARSGRWWRVRWCSWRA